MEQEHAGVQGFRVSDQGEASGLPRYRAPPPPPGTFPRR